MALRGCEAVRGVFARALQPPTDTAVDSALLTLTEIAAARAAATTYRDYHVC